MHDRALLFKVRGIAGEASINESGVEVLYESLQMADTAVIAHDTIWVQIGTPAFVGTTRAN